MKKCFLSRTIWKQKPRFSPLILRNYRFKYFSLFQKVNKCILLFFDPISVQCQLHFESITMLFLDHNYATFANTSISIIRCCRSVNGNVKSTSIDCLSTICKRDFHEIKQLWAEWETFRYVCERKCQLKEMCPQWFPPWEMRTQLLWENWWKKLW